MVYLIQMLGYDIYKTMEFIGEATVKLPTNYFGLRETQREVYSDAEYVQTWRFGLVSRPKSKRVFLYDG